MCLASLHFLSSLPAWSWVWRSRTLWLRQLAPDYCGAVRECCTDLKDHCSHPYTHIHFDRQVMGIVLVFISQLLQSDISTEHAKCHTRYSHTNTSDLPCSSSFYNNNSTTFPSAITPKDFGHATLFYLFSMAGLFLLFVITFHPKYRRVEAEKTAKFEESVYIQR